MVLKWGVGVGKGTLVTLEKILRCCLGVEKVKTGVHANNMLSLPMLR